MVPQARRASPKAVIQLRISLLDHTPTIWRQLLVPGEIKLSKLHSIFQAAMGWEGYHLHQFQIGGRSYGEPDEDIEDEDIEDEDIDEDSVHFSELVEAPMRFSYWYDFGDNWRHEVVIESIEAVPQILKFAICVDGQRACPPEDCGGIGGFEEFLEAVSNPNHEEHLDYLQWIGHPFDPEEFSLAVTNAALQRVR